MNATNGIGSGALRGVALQLGVTGAGLPDELSGRFTALLDTAPRLGSQRLDPAEARIACSDVEAVALFLTAIRKDLSHHNAPTSVVGGAA